MDLDYYRGATYSRVLDWHWMCIYALSLLGYASFQHRLFDIRRRRVDGCTIRSCFETVELVAVDIHFPLGGMCRQLGIDGDYFLINRSDQVTDILFRRRITWMR